MKYAAVMVLSVLIATDAGAADCVKMSESFYDCSGGRSSAPDPGSERDDPGSTMFYGTSRHSNDATTDQSVAPVLIVRDPVEASSGSMYGYGANFVPQVLQSIAPQPAPRVSTTISTTVIVNKVTPVMVPTLPRYVPSAPSYVPRTTYAPNTAHLTPRTPSLPPPRSRR